MWVDLEAATRDLPPETDTTWFNTEHELNYAEITKKTKFLNDIINSRSKEVDRNFEEMVKAHNDRIQYKAKCSTHLSSTQGKAITSLISKPQRNNLIDQVKTLKPNLSTSDMKVKKEMASKTLNNSRVRTKTYTPRLFDAKTLNLWQSRTKQNWYGLSPNSRDKANREMAEMKKIGLIK